MLKKLLALSDQGARKLRHGIVATTIGHLCIMAPISILMMVTMGLLEKICGDTGLTINAYSILMMAVAFLLLIFITQWIQYNLTYKVAYEESANRRITLAEKLRRLPLSFFGQRDLSDLTTTMMGDCSKLERIFSNAVPSLFGTVIMFVIVAAGLLVMDWRMGLCIVLPVPVAALILVAARRTQTRAENRNYDAHRAAYDGVQEYLDAIQELRSAGLEQEYLDGVEKKTGKCREMCVSQRAGTGYCCNTGATDGAFRIGSCFADWRFAGGKKCVVHQYVYPLSVGGRSCL